MVRWSRPGVLLIAIVTAACSTTPTESAPPPTASLTVVATPSASPEPSLSPSQSPTEPASPSQLFGTWRTTLGGENLTLVLTTDGLYRVIRGVNRGTGEIRVDGDRIDFFNSTICPGTGEYRWRIEDGALRFSSLTEPCPGRAEALLNVRYGDYSPP